MDRYLVVVFHEGYVFAHTANTPRQLKVLKQHLKDDGYTDFIVLHYSEKERGYFPPLGPKPG